LQPPDGSAPAPRGQKVSLRQLLELVDIQSVLSYQLLQSLILDLQALQVLASSAFIPPY